MARLNLKAAIPYGLVLATRMVAMRTFKIISDTIQATTRFAHPSGLMP